MKKFKMYSLAIVALGLFWATSCTRDENLNPVPGPKGNVIEVPFGYRIASELAPDGTEIPIVKNAPGNMNENHIFNVWVFQFDGTASNSKLIGAPSYVDMTVADPVLPLVESGGATHRLVFVANVNNSLYSWNMQAGSSTYEFLLGRYNTISNESSSYGGASANLTMSSTIPAVIDNTLDLTGANAPEFTRSLARVELNLSIDADKAAGFEVLSVQLCNIPARLDWADFFVTHGTIYPTESNLIDYAAETLGMPVDDGVAKKFVWYVPRNQQGTVVNAIVSQKNAFAPASATYFKILAKDGSGTGVIYRVYPGANMTDDFNIVPNYKYTIDLNIVGLGNAEQDSRIESFGTVNLADANSFIINAPPSGVAARQFNVPITRVNDYWGSGLNGYGNLGGSPIQAATKWVVKLLWQDRNNLVGTTEGESKITLKVDHGVGVTPFSILVPAGTPSGNFVVALYEAEADGTTPKGNILWSWHFWVTDYNPNQKVTVNGAKWTYPVPGGKVVRYGGSMWGYANYATNDYTYNSAITTTAPYAQSVMMDRNLGAIDAGYPAGGSGRGAIYYQYGRKDPFPGPIDLYDIGGNALNSTVWNKTNANAVEAPNNSPAPGYNVPLAVQNPMTFYMKAAGGDWSYMNEIDFLWADAKQVLGSSGAWPADLAAKQGRYGKSIYDPCPSGWKLPLNGAYNDFRPNLTVLNATRGLDWTNGIGLNGNGLRYWPYIQVGTGYPVNDLVFFPASGYRVASSGGTNLVGSNGYNWSASPNSTANAYCLSFGSAGVGPSNGSHRACGFPVRCLQE